MCCFQCTARLYLNDQEVLLVPRFGVVQGTLASGEPKVRPVDHFSWSSRGCGKKRSRATTKADSVNGHFDMPSTVSHDHLDDLMEAMRGFHERCGRVSLLLLFALCLHHRSWTGTRAIESGY